MLFSLESEYSVTVIAPASVSSTRSTPLIRAATHVQLQSTAKRIAIFVRCLCGDCKQEVKLFALRAECQMAAVRLLFDDDGNIGAIEADNRPRTVGNGTVDTAWCGIFSDYKQFGPLSHPIQR